METAETEGDNLYEMVELAAQSLLALSLNPLSNECCLSLLSDDDGNESVACDSNVQEKFAQLYKEEEPLKHTSNSCISSFKSNSRKDELAFTSNDSQHAIMKIADRVEFFNINNKEEIEEAM
eukprot:15358204-Ditylum_brightwellii.AAC.1